MMKVGFFNPHYDPYPGDDDDLKKRMNNNSGPRRYTILIYLNDDFEGGETEFPNIGRKIVPEKGKAVLFVNTDNNENIYKESYHGGNPVKNGTKWVCNKWVHFSKY